MALIPTYDPGSSTLSQFVYAMNDGSGNDSLKVDRDGPGSTYSFETVAQLTGVTGPRCRHARGQGQFDRTVTEINCFSDFRKPWLWKFQLEKSGG